jgi:ABC-2 type transport system permease protein
MRTYWSFFKIRFINGLQYRAAAYAGIATQFAWGFMYIMLYHSFYRTNPSASNMSISELSSYIWLQQGFLALFMTWFLDNDIFEAISSGNVAYEICRPLDIYNMWFAKSCAIRVSKAVLRCIPILILASFLPVSYKFDLPHSIYSFSLFLISVIVGTVVVVSYSMLIYIFTFFTVSPVGVRMTMVMLADFFAGGLIPLPMLPDYLTKYIYLSPFASMQNSPFRIYTGGISGIDAVKAVILQLFWTLVLIGFGKLIMKKAMKKVIVQGG